LGEEGELPLLIKPVKPELNLASWLESNKDQFEKELVQYGGILFRGFEVKDLNDFNTFLKCFNTDPLPYMFRSSPREELDKSVRNIYKSTIYPQERSITLHNESSYSRFWGKQIVFCCLKPAQEGGETPIADSRKILRDIDPELVNKFRQKGVKYLRNISPNLGMSWQEVFQTSDRDQAISICRKYDITYNFLDEHNLMLEWKKPAIYMHPATREETWFNHIYFFNKYTRYKELGVELEDDIPAEFLSSDTLFGDGSNISINEYRNIEQAYEKNTKCFRYSQGDILFLDNMLTAHGRRAYKGERTIATAIIEAMSD
jgi:alpha-ketoglutarate-dependent taurine dioxygenase